MELPFTLQRLPSEALEVLRFLHKHRAAATSAEIQEGAQLSARLVGRAIRRLVNFRLVQFHSDRYALTSDGQIAAQQLLEYDAALAAKSGGRAELPRVPRRLTVVMPRVLRANTPADLFVGVNPPTANMPLLPQPAHITLRVSALGGTLSLAEFALEVPVDKAAVPAKLSLTPDQAGRAVRVRIDAFQAVDADQLQFEPLGGMYFDVRVSMDATQDSALRAVGMDMLLKPIRI
ncbi:MAG: hypothetical protein CUN49_05335 [Candidatus Thermofonsia Clade 1 bacterium]|jgi:hypothetical protein|uniref:Uncharacterized protein n=1 Tax=Candidatus Thermofonsia Clade 1 bacterium TaxID=2364210 RepID=A0A2M8PFY0_9CHLR|nr:MAG: hypothetical protein CUN49_05335 [Candidatus Thermofonsia Clade 1 bacterium]RMF50129.1 MAG: hypothetical protein D6749_11395 [Chloroflexota bacterium]